MRRVRIYPFSGARIHPVWGREATCDRLRLLCGRSAVGSAEPCQGSGRRFEPGRPLEGSRPLGSCAVEWPRGEAAACKAAYTGSNPVSTSVLQPGVRPHGRLAQGLARFLDTEEVTGSIPVSPTKKVWSGFFRTTLFLSSAISHI